MTEELNQTFSKLFEKRTNKYLRENKKNQNPHQYYHWVIKF